MKTAEWDVVVIGGVNMDYLVRGPRLPRAGETLEGVDLLEAPGGKGANQAVAAARLGARVALIGRIGSDPRGQMLRSRLENEGVDTRYLVQSATEPTGVAVIMVGERGEKQILVAPGANRRLAVEDVRAAAHAISSTRVLLSQLEVPLECVMEAARLAHESGARVLLDPAPAVPLPDDLLRMLDIIRPNSSEAELLAGVQVTDRASARRAADQLLRRGAGAAVVQAGSQGDLLVWPDGEHFLPRLPVESVDATGAGDAFAAAMAVQIGEGVPLEKAATFASAAAALATTKFGAQAGLPSRQAVHELLDRFAQAGGGTRPE